MSHQTCTEPKRQSPTSKGEAYQYIYMLAVKYRGREEAELSAAKHSFREIDQCGTRVLLWTQPALQAIQLYTDCSTVGKTCKLYECNLVNHPLPSLQTMPSTKEKENKNINNQGCSFVASKERKKEKFQTLLLKHK